MNYWVLIGDELSIIVYNYRLSFIDLSTSGELLIIDYR